MSMSNKGRGGWRIVALNQFLEFFFRNACNGEAPIHLPSGQARSLRGLSDF